MDFNNFCVVGNRNEVHLQIMCLIIYFICDVHRTSFIFQQDSAPGHRARDNATTHHFRFHNARHWPTNSPELNPVDYVIRSVIQIQQRLYETRVRDIDELRQRLLHVCVCDAVWCSRWLMMQLTNGQHACVPVFMSEVDILNILRLSICFLCTRWTLCSTSCLMQKVMHYKSINVMFYISQGSVSTVFRWCGYFCMRVYRISYILSALLSALGARWHINFVSYSVASCNQCLKVAVLTDDEISLHYYNI